MATKRLGRGLEALLVDVPTEFGFESSVALDADRKKIAQEYAQLLKEAEQLKNLLDTFEQLVLEFDKLQN